MATAERRTVYLKCWGNVPSVPGFPGFISLMEDAIHFRTLGLIAKSCDRFFNHWAFWLSFGVGSMVTKSFSAIFLILIASAAILFAVLVIVAHLGYEAAGGAVCMVVAAESLMMFVRVNPLKTSGWRTYILIHGCLLGAMGAAIFADGILQHQPVYVSWVATTAVIVYAIWLHRARAVARRASKVANT